MFFKRLLLLLILGVIQNLPANNPPNVIVIMVDDMGYSDIGCYGGEIKTPNLDKLAAYGLRIRQFYSTGKCHSSRVSLLSGLHSYQAGELGKNGTIKMHNGNIARGVSLAQVLRKAGYFTAVSGKWHISPEPLNMGFNRFFGFLPGYVKDYFACKKLELNGTPYVHKGTENRYITDQITDYGIKFFEEAQAREKPCFLYLAYNAPHYPLQAPQEDINKYKGKYLKGYLDTHKQRIEKMKRLKLIEDNWSPASAEEVKLRDWNAFSQEERNYQDLLMATYAAMIDRIDQNIGRLVKTLESSGALDNTLILFFSDNGATEATMVHEREQHERKLSMSTNDSFTVYGDWAYVSNAPFRLFKTHMHEGGVISPLIAHWPKGISVPGGSIDHKNMFQLIDIMPTLVDICGANYPDTYDGRKIEPMKGVSMLPSFKGQQADRKEGMYFMFGLNRAYRLGDWKLVSKGTSRWELYNLADDPTEKNDLATKNPEKVELLKKMWWKIAKEDERLPPQISKPNSDKSAVYKRFLMRQGNNRVPGLNEADLKKRYGKGVKGIKK